MIFKEYKGSDVMMSHLADVIADEVLKGVQMQESATLAVPGGTTPGPIFDRLCTLDAGWDKVAVMLSDERWVDESSDRSNTRLLRQRLLRDKAAAATLLPLYASGGTAEEKIPALAAAIAPHLPLTVCLLGMGTDMHTASIFPGADRLHDALTGSDILYPMRAPGAPEPRITLSASVLRQAQHLHIVITGQDKRDAFEQARISEAEYAPVATVLQKATVHWAKT